MRSTIISPLSNIISSLTCFHARATKFEWMLDHYVVNAYAQFHSQILRRGRITIWQVRGLQYYAFDHYFSIFKHNF